MTPISINIPESLSSQKSELEAVLASITAKEGELVAQRKEIEISLSIIATGIAVLSGQPLPAAPKNAAGTARKPMSAEARENIRQGLIRSREAKAQAAQIVGSAPETPVEAPVTAQVPVTAEEPMAAASQPFTEPQPVTTRESRASRKAGKE